MNEKLNEEEKNYEILNDIEADKIDYTFKIIVIGNAGVGKSCLAIKASKNIFDLNYQTTIGVEFFDLIIKLKENKKIIKLQIWDTCGQEIYRSLLSTYYKKTSLALIVYAINDQNSFNNIESWVKDLRANSNPDVKIFLIGNKQDLEKERKIEKFRGEKLCNDYQLDFFFETSAKSGFNVKEIFVLAAKILSREIYEIKSELKNNKKKKLEGKSKLILGNSFLENNKKHCC
jgi:small GTP-binding protein